MPTMSPPTEPIRDATSPRAPGRSGSHTRTSTCAAVGSSADPVDTTTPVVEGTSTASHPTSLLSRPCYEIVTRCRPYTAPMGERIGVLGGTFDPVHIGHLVAAADARHALHLDRVLLVPAGDPWQKRGQVVASGADRLALVRGRGRRGSTGSRRPRSRSTGPARPSPPTPSRRSPRRAGRSSSSSAPTRWPTCRPGSASTRHGTWPRSSSSNGPATRTPSRPGRAGASSGSRSPASTCRRARSRGRLFEGRPVAGLLPVAVIEEIRARGLYTAP